MNERIKELAEQAVVFASRTFKVDTDSWKLAYNEKFAELIIAECTDMFPDDLSSMRDYTGKACRYMIKEHFGLTKTVVGVEE